MTGLTTLRSRLSGKARRIGLSASLLALGLAAGCGNVHHIEVGSIPEDYRTRHPIVVSEDQQAIDIPIVASESGLGPSQRSRVEDFAYRYLTSGADGVRLLIPYGSRNSAAAGRVSGEIVALLVRNNVPRGQIFVESYAAHTVHGPTPIRLAYSTLIARTGPCGRWPEDLASTSENENYHNFGCATQQNLAAQIADPRDLLAPRGIGAVDAHRRSDVIEKYRRGEATASARGNTESNYEW